MKIGIITFTYGQNYGNKLQNYALLSFLRKRYGDEVYTLQNFDETTKRNVKENFKNRIKALVKFKDEKYKKNRKMVFDTFNNQYLNYYNIPLVANNFEKFKDFDAFICGSDQIWNPYYNKNMELFTASFSKNAKRISYAASIGLSELPQSDVDKYVKTVGSMDYIGVREKEGANLLEKLLKRDIKVQIDPTMLLDSNDWNIFSKRPNKDIPNEYILTYFIKNMDEKTSNTILNFAKKNNLKIINLNDIAQKKWYDIDPCEFCWMIKNAKFVFSDSFHATVFSIIFHVPFHCFERKNKEKINKQESRLYTLLGYFDLKERIGNFYEDKLNNIDWKKIDSTMIKLREESVNYLYSTIGNAKKSICNVYDRKEECSGCGLCSIECKSNAISMKLDEEGFRYPVIDKEKCINCGRCKDICTYKNPVRKLNTEIDKNAYKIKNKNEDVRLNSSSGGVFSAIAEKVISNNGIVVSTKFNEKFELNHEFILHSDKIKKYRGSKYTQSKTENVFPLIKKELENSREVLYTGTPCQINALKKYLKDDYNNLITQDLICHGCTSESIFKEYLRAIEKKFKSKIIDVNFRAKDKGWRNFGIKIKFENGKEIFEIHSKNKFFKLFLDNYSLRPSCYDCVYRKFERISDITLADFWGTSDSDDRGISLVLENNKSINILKKLENIEIEQVDYYASIKNNSAFNKPIYKPKNRNKVLSKKNIKLVFIKYKVDVLKRKIYRKFNKIFF